MADTLTYRFAHVYEPTGQTDQPWSDLPNALDDSEATAAVVASGSQSDANWIVAYGLIDDEGTLDTLRNEAIAGVAISFDQTTDATGLWQLRASADVSAADDINGLGFVTWLPYHDSALATHDTGDVVSIGGEVMPLTAAQLRGASFGVAILMEGLGDSPLSASATLNNIQVTIHLAGGATLMNYASSAQVAAWLGTAAPADVERLLSRATELIDEVTRGNIDADSTVHMTAAQAACCAQVEYWGQNREETEFEGQVVWRGIGKISTTYKDGNPILAPRAYRALLNAGLLYCGVGTVSTQSETSFTT